MQSFGKAIRGSMPAIGLGLLTAFGVAAVTAGAAPSAFAQQVQVKVKKEFGEPFEAARLALQAQQFQVALDKAAAAAPFAADNTQKSAVEQIRVAAYASLKNYPETIKSIDTALALGVPPEMQKNYKGLLAVAYSEAGDVAKSVQITKEYLDAYGGAADQYAYVARNKLNTKEYDEAVSYANKAIEQNEKEGKGPNATYYNIVLSGYGQGNKLAEYYNTLAKVAPILNKDIYWRPLIEGAKREPKYKREEGLLDVYRALEQAKVPLTPQQQQEMGEIALNSGMAIESERVLAPLFAAGTLGGPGDAQADRNKKFYAKAQADAKADKAGGLAQSEKEAANKPTGAVYVSTGESYLGAGDYAKAAELLKKGLEKGGLEPGAADLARLRLGIAQMKGGQKEEARKTWAEVKGDNGSAWLAKVWTALSKV
jgi:tetratricopeptide (TPR) repeat protein